MPQHDTSRPFQRTGLAVAAALFVMALLLVSNPLRFRSPVAPPVPVAAWATDTSPVRRPKMRPDYEVAPFTFECNACHRIIPPPANTHVRTATQHREVVLKHGINTWCLNCHHPQNRNVLVNDRGEEIPWDQPQRLCAKCHGPVYRDWLHGAHGRTNGYWDTSRGEQSRRKCIECHDPHQPPFPPMRPAPGPETLRMGPQGPGGHGEVRNPLRVAGHGEDAAAGDFEPEEGN